MESHAGRRVRMVLAVLLAVVAGLLSAWLTPRGPATAAQALVSMAAAVGVGVAGGGMMASRWSMVALPVAYMAVFEIARMGVDGPTVDRIHLTSVYGVIAFVVGRGAHGLLVLIPMALGARYGVTLARAGGGSGPAAMRAPGRAVSLLSALVVIAMAVAIARPATTAPIVGADGEPLAGSIAELVTIPIGGHDQTMMVRGSSADDPVLLFLAGGPGGTELGAMRLDTGLEDDFVVVTWEQRGAGSSYPSLDPPSTLTLEQMIDDTVDVVHHFRERFGEDKVYLVGQSWGTTLGGLVVQRHPELFHAFVGVGQMVSQRETDIMFYEDTLTWAATVGNEGLAEDLRRSGPPPYDDLLSYEPALSHEHDWNPYPDLDVSREMPAILFVPEYDLMGKVNGLRGFLDTFSVLYPQLQEIDFRVDIAALDVPYYMVAGRHEARGRATLADEWFASLEAPVKERIVFEHSGHRPLFEEPARFVQVMRDVVADVEQGN